MPGNRPIKRQNHLIPCRLRRRSGEDFCDGARSQHIIDECVAPNHAWADRYAQILCGGEQTEETSKNEAFSPLCVSPAQAGIRVYSGPDCMPAFAACPGPRAAGARHGRAFFSGLLRWSPNIGIPARAGIASQEITSSYPPLL